MNKLFFYILAFSALTFASCSEEDDLISDALGDVTEVTFTATFEEEPAAAAASRTTVENRKVYWSAGDVISVLNSENGFDKFTLSGGEGTGNGKFTGTFTAGTTAGNIAIYPAGNHSYDGTNLTVNLPSSYGSPDEPYTPNANVLMMAKKTDADGNNLNFKHLAALVRIPLKVPVGAVSVSLTAKGICGDFVVDTDADIPYISLPTDATDKTVTYKFSAFEAEQTVSFYFPLPVGTYDSFKVTITTNNEEEGSKTMKPNSGIDFPRTKLIGLTPFAEITIPLEKVDYVDLGLSVLWAKTNIGATSPDERGGYFAWGETTTKQQYGWSTYLMGSSSSALTEYTNTEDVLLPEHDAATVNWGAPWRMPTSQEMLELIHNTNVTVYKNADAAKCPYGVPGIVFAHKNDPDSHIFLPTAGYNTGTSVSSTALVKYCRYWSSMTSASNASYGQSLDYNVENAKLITVVMASKLVNNARAAGLPIRPVRPK